MDLWRRLKKIEREQAKHQARRGCSECGAGVPGVEIQYRVAFSDEPVEGPEHCPKCGRSLRFAITFDQEG